MTFRKLLLGGALGLALTSAAYAAGVYTPGFPAAPFPLTGVEQIPADTQLPNGANPQTEYITTSQLRGYERAPLTPAYAASIAVDASLGNTVLVGTLTGNTVLANPTNLQSGQTIRYELTQDGTGSRLVTYGTLFTFSGSSTVSTTAGYVDMVTCVYDGTKLRCTLATHFV